MSERVVHVIDDDEAVRDSLAFLFASVGLKAVTYAGPEAFLAVASDLSGGCIVTDVRMPGMNGLELVRVLRERGVALPVIVITGHGDIPMAVEAMREGALDFLEKPFDDEALLRSVNAALDRDEAEPIAGGFADRIRLLSDRERQVLDGLLEGLPNKTIAYDLGISARTVEIYRAKAMTKMGAGSFAELVRMAIHAGLGPK